MLDFICKNNRNELCDTGKNQIPMKRFLILNATSCKVGIILDVVDVPFDNSPNFIGVIPFFGSMKRSGITPKILFRIYVDHASAS